MYLKERLQDWENKLLKSYFINTKNKTYDYYEAEYLKIDTAKVQLNYQCQSEYIVVCTGKELLVNKVYINDEKFSSIKTEKETSIEFKLHPEVIINDCFKIVSTDWLLILPSTKNQWPLIKILWSQIK
jgi:hypothetical protein